MNMNKILLTNNSRHFSRIPCHSEMINKSRGCLFGWPDKIAEPSFVKNIEKFPTMFDVATSCTSMDDD